MTHQTFQAIKLFPDFTSTGLWDADTGQELSTSVLPDHLAQAVKAWHQQWASWDIGFRQYDPSKEPMTKAWLEREGYTQWYDQGQALALRIQEALSVPALCEADSLETVCRLHNLNA